VLIRKGLGVKSPALFIFKLPKTFWICFNIHNIYMKDFHVVR